MRTMIIIAGAALALGACNRNDDRSVDANAMAENNMLAADDGLGMADADAGGMDANADTNAAVEDAKMKDLTTNDADTNLANGL